MAEGEKAHQEARVLFQRLADQHPEVLEYAVDLGGCYANLGHLAQDKGIPETALEWYTRAIRCEEAVLQKERREVSAREVLSIAHESRAKVLSKLGRHAEALPDCERALEYDNGRDRDAIRLSRAEVLARAGHYARAAAEANDLAQARSPSGGDLYNLARVYSLAAAAVSRADKPPPADRDKLSQQYASRAVELLTKTRATGYFKDRANTERMSKHSDFDALRLRADFKRLLADLAKPEAAGK
jgi:tetratricopeptide (TPR) repeat protein